MPDVLDTRLGRYDIRQRLGRGGMATVYKGWDTNLDRVVAVKVLHDHLVEDSDFRQRFEREAKLLAGLNHPNIVQIYDFDHTERGRQPIYYMVMAFIDGPTLRQVMEQYTEKGKTLTLPEISKVMENVCAALTYAHRQGISHRDVTPSNILYDAQGRIVLADFGLARLVAGTRLTQTGMTTGTPIYMSPEQGMGLPGDMRSDLYSLGVILFEMLSGSAPYTGESAYAIIMQHVNAPIPTLPTVNGPSALASKALSMVIDRALSKEPEDRYQNAEEFLADFQAAVRGELPTAVRPGAVTVNLPSPGPTPTVRLGSVIRPGRLPLFAVSAVILVLIVLSVILLQSQVNTANSSKPTAIAPTVEVTLAVLPTKPPTGGDSMVEAAVPIQDNFQDKTHAAWELASDDPHISRQYIDGVLRIQNTLLATAITTVINPRSANYDGPIIIEADMTISTKSQSPSATGIIFRYNSEDEYYVFAFDGVGRVSIWLRQKGVWTELRHLPAHWTPADGVNSLGKSNHLKLIVNDTHLQGYINDHLVIDLITPVAIDGGGVGIYLASTTNPTETSPFAQVDVADYSVQLYMPFMTPSSGAGGSAAAPTITPTAKMF